MEMDTRFTMFMVWFGVVLPAGLLLWSRLIDEIATIVKGMRKEKKNGNN